MVTFSGLRLQNREIHLGNRRIAATFIVLGARVFLRRRFIAGIQQFIRLVNDRVLKDDSIAIGRTGVDVKEVKDVAQRADSCIHTLGDLLAYLYGFLELVLSFA